MGGLIKAAPYGCGYLLAMDDRKSIFSLPIYDALVKSRKMAIFEILHLINTTGYKVHFRDI
jgi:hypothetical protein